MSNLSEASWPGKLRRSVGRWRALLACTAAILPAALLPCGSSHAATGLANLAPVVPVMDCAAVTTLDLTNVTDAAVTIKSATVIATGAPAPYCEVRGTIAPANTIVMRLPVNGWTQRYVQTGCGGECGSSNINYGKGADCPVVADGTVASATTDMGHQGQNDGSWTVDNPQAQIDFAYRGVHVTAQVAKAVIGKFYGRRPVYSYFNGCSDGGREALMEAQRYPDDFDGIAAGAPANNMIVQNTFHHGWNVLTNKDASGNYILLAGKLPMIHTAVLAACDGLDGVVDGVIDDPRRCRFNPASLLCKAGQDPATCLTEAEAGVVRRLHDGATDAQGRRLEPEIAHEWGSELAWTLFVPATQGVTVGSENFVNAFARYLAYFNTYNPDWKLTDLQFTVPSFWQTVQTSNYLAAMDPDISHFARSGGKLLLWHGWNDQHISPQGTLAYYDALRKAFGDRALDRFAKLYLFPGVTHCGGGEGPDSFDILTPVMAWVEGGVEPGKIVASKVSNGVTTRTRPVFPYPAVARYLGTGSSDEESSFVAVTPRHEPDVDYQWVGKRLYSHGYQASCQAVGTQLVCTPGRLQFGHERAPGDED